MPVYPYHLLERQIPVFLRELSVENNRFDGFLLTAATGRSLCVGLSIKKRRDTPLKIAVFSWVVVSAKLMGDSTENSLPIFIRGGEPWLMNYCWRTLTLVLIG
jgi:hypothetical protein